MLRRRGFTLIELMVVISIILVLVSIAVALLGDMWRIGDRVKCASNLRQIGQWLISEAMRLHAYPSGGPYPGAWGASGEVYSSALAQLKTADIFRCPADGDDSLISPRQFAQCSYAYMGSLSPTYTCHCDSCGEDPGKKIWSLYWAGVQYTGNHDQANHTNFRDFPLADNLRWNTASIDPNEPTDYPTVPVHQDTEKFHDDDRPKYRTQRALREIPETPEDQGSNVPLVMDIVAMSSMPPGVSTWEKAHLFINTDADKQDRLFANHCGTSAVGKKDWGINVLFTDQSVRWKNWDEIRFQVKAKNVSVGSGTKNLCFFF